MIALGNTIEFRKEPDTPSQQNTVSSSEGCLAGIRRHGEVARLMPDRTDPCCYDKYSSSGTFDALQYRTKMFCLDACVMTLPNVVEVRG